MDHRFNNGSFRGVRTNGALIDLYCMKPWEATRAEYFNTGRICGFDANGFEVILHATDLALVHQTTFPTPVEKTGEDKVIARIGAPSE